MTYTQKISAQANLVRTLSFDTSTLAQGLGADYGAFTNAGAPNAVAPVLDTTFKASGQNSIKFTIPSQSGSGSSGQWFMNFSTDRLTQFGEGQTVYIQYMQAFDRYFFEHTFLITSGSGGWKQSIIGQGDPTGSTCVYGGDTTGCSLSHSNIEWVLQNTGQRKIPGMYNDNSGISDTTAWEVPFGGSDFKLQNGMPSPFCLYSTLPTASGCLHYADGLASGGDQVTMWATITFQLTIGSFAAGTYTGNTANVDWSWGGQTAQRLWSNIVWNQPAPAHEKYGKLWLLPYHTNKDSTEVHNVTYTWLANPIVATSPIPLTTDEVQAASTAKYSIAS